MTWRAGDSGRTRGAFRYRILAHDLKGSRGPIVAALEIAEEELLKRYQADGTDGGAFKAYELQPPTSRAPA